MEIVKRAVIDKYHRALGETGSEALVKLSAWIRPQTTVLDVGCATGSLGTFLSSIKGCVVDGVDRDLQAVLVARTAYRYLQVTNLESTDLRLLFPRGAYDYVVVADVLEHLRDPQMVLRAAAELLRPGGELLVSVPNFGFAPVVAELLTGRFGYRPTGILDDTHVRLFTGPSIRGTLQEAGFRMAECARVHKEPHESEFGTRCLEALPPAVLGFVTSLPEANTYQFLLRAVRAEDLLAVDAVVAEPEPLRLLTPVHLYWRSGSEYRAEWSSTIYGELARAEQTLRLEVPPLDGGLQGLRVDLGDRPGVVYLLSIRLLGPREEEIWTWSGEVGHLQQAYHERMTIEEPAPPGAGAVLVLAGPDASLELPLGHEYLDRCSGGCAVELELSWPPSPDYMLLVDKMGQRISQLAETESRLAGLVRQVAQLDRLLERRFELLKQTQTRYEEAVRERDRALHRLDEQARVLADLEQGGNARALETLRRRLRAPWRLFGKLRNRNGSP